MMKSILLPTDFSPAANNALEYAAQLAQRIEATLTLLHVQPLQATDWFSAGAGLPNDLAMRTETAEDKMKAQCELVEQTFQVACKAQVLTSTTDLDTSLRDLLNERDFSLVVMGTNGTDDLYQFMFGSNAWNVINKANCPVWMVPQDCAYETPSKTVFATAYEDHEFQAMEQMVALLKPLNAHVSTLHVSESEPNESKVMGYRELLTATFGPNAGIEHHDIVAEDVAEGIDDWVHQHGTDLLVMVRPHRPFLEELFHRSLTKKLTAISDIPMLVYH